MAAARSLVSPLLLLWRNFSLNESSSERWIPRVDTDVFYFFLMVEILSQAAASALSAAQLGLNPAAAAQCSAAPLTHQPPSSSLKRGVGWTPCPSANCTLINTVSSPWTRVLTRVQTVTGGDSTLDSAGSHRTCLGWSMLIKRLSSREEETCHHSRFTMFGGELVHPDVIISSAARSPFGPKRSNRAPDHHDHLPPPSSAAQHSQSRGLCVASCTSVSPPSASSC
ncbi:unnamed protein product [Pleuronectes platessa]|uniref:Uncharacterized protein n=1 Tax=Pleuronectes platessa TaxID=8262 RepID=A0A9N7UV56_PLEPL|nr:unnamed protein product [Pleuronectes platessa]